MYHIQLQAVLVHCIILYVTKFPVTVVPHSQVQHLILWNLNILHHNCYDPYVYELYFPFRPLSQLAFPVYKSARIEMELIHKVFVFVHVCL